MKNTLLKRALVLLPLLIGGIIISCQDEMVDSVEMEKDNKVLKEKIEKAITVFEKRSPDFPIIGSRTVDGIQKGIVFEPVWDESFVTNHDDGTTTVETHVRLSQPFHLLPQESKEAYEQTKDERYLRHLSRVVVLMPNDDSTSFSFLMTIVGSKEYMESHNFQLWDISYGNIPEDFSGMLFYHSLNGDFVNGWYVNEGCIFHTCEPISPEDANLLSRSSTDCHTETVTYYYYDCITVNGYSYATYENEESNSQVYVCSGPQTVTYSYQVCSGSGSTGGGGYNPTNDLSRIFASYNSNLRTNLQGFLGYMESYDDASAAVLSYIENYLIELGVYNKMNVDINTTQNVDVSYNSGTNTLYFKSADSYSDLAMHEELVHSIQRVVYANYGETTFNTEFEAKLIVDYARLSNGYSGNTDMSLNMKYVELELEDGSTKTMAKWLDDLSYSYFSVSDYSSYMTTWNNFAFNYQNCMMDPHAQPQLVYSIIDEINN